MRLDYVLYVVGVICFIVAGVFIADAAGMFGTGVITIEESMKQMTPIIFSMLGIIFAVGGYILRPRTVFPTITVSTPHEPEQIQPVEEKIEIPATPVEEAPSPAEAPVPEPKTLHVERTIPPKAPNVEKHTKVAKEERKKPTKRRRRRKRRQKQS